MRARHGLVCAGIVWIVALAALAFGDVSAWADARFTHDYQSEEILLGAKEAQVTVAYTPEGMFVQKQTRFISSWMQRFFGEVKQERIAAYFMLDREQIREIDWPNRRIYVFDFDKLDKIQWIRNTQANQEALQEHLSQRYEVKAPQLTIDIAPGQETIEGYPCRRIEARLRLETVDRHKNASSITLVTQTLWLSTQVEGYADYQVFHTRLADRLGIAAQRLGPLSYLLAYWDGSLAPLQDDLAQIEGYTVKSQLEVLATYVPDRDSAAAKPIEKSIKKETMRLRAVSTEPIDASEFSDPPAFEIILAQ